MLLNSVSAAIHKDTHFGATNNVLLEATSHLDVWDTKNWEGQHNYNQFKQWISEHTNGFWILDSGFCRIHRVYASTGTSQVGTFIVHMSMSTNDDEEEEKKAILHTGTYIGSQVIDDDAACRRFVTEWLPEQSRKISHSSGFNAHVHAVSFFKVERRPSIMNLTFSRISIGESTALLSHWSSHPSHLNNEKNCPNHVIISTCYVSFLAE